MNKQRFLAELRRLLVFMTEYDRDLTIRRYTDMFDDAGEEGEYTLIKSLGTPTKVAISLSRGYEPGKAAEQYENLQAQKKQQKSAPLPEVSWDDMPEFTLPGDFEPAPPEPEEPEDEQEDEEDNAQEEYEPAKHEQAEYEPPQTQPWSSSRQPVKRPMPLGLGVPLFVLALIAVGLPLAAVVLALTLILLCPGAGAVLGAWLSAVGALWCMTYIADALLMFGLAFLILAVALMLLWAGVWVDVIVVGAYARLVRAFAGAVFGKRRAQDE